MIIMNKGSKHVSDLGIDKERVDRNMHAHERTQLKVNKFIGESKINKYFPMKKE